MGRGRKARILVRSVQRKVCNFILSHVDMERIKAELELSRDLLGVLHVTEKELGSELKLLIALELFREEKISSGKAAEVAGLSKSKFIDELDWRGIPYFTETPEELAAQVEAMRRLLRDS